MDDNCAQDGVYAGRYVLVEYDTALSNSDYNKGYYLITDTSGNHIPYGSINTCTTTNSYLYFNGPVETTHVTSSVLSTIKYKVIYFDANKHFTIINNAPIYIKLKRNGSYVGITWEQFRAYYNYQGDENNLTSSTISQLDEQEIVHAHIANGVAHIEDNSLFVNENTEIYAVVLPGANYTYNVDAEFWTIEDNVFVKDGLNYSKLSQIPNDASGNYTANFNIDKGRYRTARGYDSTVWQKVYQNGTEKYVMVAELNTIIPSFGVSSDPPSLLPISPHFGADSTNAYYELHWQPSWGFRVKAANNSLLMPAVKPNGQLDITDPNKLDSQVASIRARKSADDNVYYPSDQRVPWKQTFEDSTLNHDEKRKTLFYNPVNQKWENDTALKVPAAIYFNRSGFDPDRIAYSSDLSSEDSRTSSPSWNRYNANIATSGWINEDNISLTPTGYSGNSYNLHDGSVDLKPQPDTQELSIMLPSIGDTVAKVWDLVYGGRDTTENIRKSNHRNRDIAWEDAKGEPAKRGLRLTGASGNQYNVKQVDTLAGSINTAHDLIGMIISPNTAEELEDVDNLDVNRIYYDTTNNRYVRKHKTYEYDEISADMFDYNEQTSSNLNQEKINSGLYYELINGEYVIATVYDPSKTYYLRQIQDQYTPVTGTIVDFPYENYKWYQDYLGENSKVIQDIMEDTILSEAEKQQQILLKSDYILNSSYQEGKDYYSVTEQKVNLQNSYQSNTYWVISGTDGGLKLTLDSRPTKTKNTTYYTLDLNKLEQFYRIKEVKHFSGVYVPGKYSFRKKDGSYEVDLTPDQSCNGELARDNVELTNIINPDGTQGPSSFKYYILDVIRTYDMDGQEVLYRRIINYNLVTDLTAETFISGVYFIQTYDTNNELVYEKIDNYDPNITEYYLQQINYIKIEDTSQVEINVSQSFYKGDLVVYNAGMYFEKNVNNSGETIGFTEITRYKFINEDIGSKEIYVFGDKETAENPPFLTLDEAIIKNDVIHQQDNFYQENTYHFKKNGSYILDTSPSMTTGREYYLITPTKLSSSLTYYVPEQYYIQDENVDEYSIAITPQKPNSTIYKKEELYVKNDTRKILPKGTKWNQYAAAVPDEITLATRREKWEIVQIPNYSVSTGTINGTILKMFQVIEPYDTLTRSNDNISGVINQVKDILAKFETMKSQEIMVIDNYGRAHSAAIATSQINSFNQIKENYQDMIDSITKDRYPEAANVNAMTKRWITVNVDGDPDQPILTIHHNFQPVTPTTSTFDFNGNGDTIDIITPIVDAMGHTVGTDTKTVTLPYNFKTFTISNEDTDDAGAATTPGSNGSIIADNTQDTFIFKTVDKWLRFVTDSDNDTLTIAHKLHTLTTAQSEARTTNKNSDGVASNSDADKIILHDIVWDDAAHMLEDHPHTYTLPYGFKFIATSAASDAVTDLEYVADQIAAESTQDTFTIKPANKWIKLSANASDDSITFGHLVQNIDVEASISSNLNVADNITTVTNNNNQINIQDITHDEAGHLRSRKDHIYTLPYGFKFITTNGTIGDTTTDITSNTNVAIALNTQDTFSIDVGNTWLKTAVDVANRKIILYHYVKNNIDYVDSNSTDFNNISNGIFTLKDITHDEAGHITAYKTHQYTLPYSFKTFTHTNSLTGINDLNFEEYVAANHNIVADNVVDSFTFASQNKWIRLQADNKTLKISHLVTNVESSNNTESLITTEGGKTFTVVETLSIDEAGHITAFNNKTYTVPNSFYKISVTNSTNVNQITANTDTNNLEADCTNDTLNVVAGDRWILLNGNTDTDTLTIGHASPNSAVTSYAVQPENQNVNPNSMNYGESFKVPTFSIDGMGHIYSAQDTILKLPSISLTTTDSAANVLTDISLNSTTGAFTYNRANVGTLTLTGYSYVSSEQSAAAILNTDSINSAFAKLTKQIENEVTATTGARDIAIANAINALDSSLTNSEYGKTISKITITDGKLSDWTFENIQVAADQVTVDDNTNFDARYYTEVEIDNKITSLIHTQTNNGINLGVGQTITSLTEVDGKINYTVSNIEITSSQVTDFNTAFNDLLPTGNDAFLSVGAAASTYLTQSDAASTYANISLEENAYTDDTVFSYSTTYTEEGIDYPYIDPNETLENLTIQQLVAKVKELENRIYNLENPAIEEPEEP